MIEFRKQINLETVGCDLNYITEKIKNKGIPQSREISEKISEVSQGLSDLLSELESTYGLTG
jgi:hypothetical protein